MVTEGKDQSAIETELSDAWQIVQTFARLKFLATSNIRYLGRMLGQAELRKTIGYSGFSARTADSIYALPRK